MKIRKFWEARLTFKSLMRASLEEGRDSSLDPSSLSWRWGFWAMFSPCVQHNDVVFQVSRVCFFNSWGFQRKGVKKRKEEEKKRVFFVFSFYFLFCVCGCVCGCVYLLVLVSWSGVSIFEQRGEMHSGSKSMRNFTCSLLSNVISHFKTIQRVFGLFVLSGLKFDLLW